ncbi:pre-mRNA-splicing factor ISY1 [Trypanosoma grayi]|uniref:pre-mRNA-splicing factor ISY1 n=1 Tax=Trypanosoma grayi TaxID=71804 RepID=UPI0004F44EB2|nr:pre-mRNA-splicing factor ISY1 [Trypanosoma grayi]KEG07736.1 pre-mRNA-splicing factor ISY1 [Trypanosoma grayi]
MQDHLREIEGTLARKNERQSTLLYKLAKRKAEEERLSRLGVRSIPSNPLDVTDVKVVKYALFKLKQEIGDKIAKIRNSELLSIESQGEVVIRAKNDDINHLISRRNLWERRMATLSGQSYKAPPSRKLYFGCAKGLPEARKGIAQDDHGHEDDVMEEVESESVDSHISEDVPSHPSSTYLKQLMAHNLEDLLRSAEMAAERRLRSELGEEHVGTAEKRSREENTDYNVDVELPPEEGFRRKIFDKRKDMLQTRLKSLKK